MPACIADRARGISICLDAARHISDLTRAYEEARYSDHLWAAPRGRAARPALRRLVGGLRRR